jgi:hypothetical protein
MEERQALRLLRIRVEVVIRLGAPVELEQVVGEQPAELLSIVESCFAQPYVHALTLPGLACLLSFE